MDLSLVHLIFSLSNNGGIAHTFATSVSDGSFLFVCDQTLLWLPCGKCGRIFYNAINMELGAKREFVSNTGPILTFESTPKFNKISFFVLNSYKTYYVLHT
jgi:hypothetical protein